MSKIHVGVSSCLLGHKVRFDSGHKHNRFITNKLSDYFEFRPFCPEVNIGLEVPREPIRLVTSNSAKERQKNVRCVGTKNSKLDVTDSLKKSAIEQRRWLANLSGYIVKKDSPSCGMERVKLYRNDFPERTGVGIFIQQVMSDFPNLPIEEEGRLCDPRLRENFISRVFIYDRWKKMVESGLTWKSFYHFHAQHKFILMSHSQNKARALGKQLAQSDKADIQATAEAYITELMSILKIVATQKNHTNALQHMAGFMRKRLDEIDRGVLKETIDSYRKGFIPLVVPIILLKSFLIKYNQNYLEQSLYLSPYPNELALRNHL
ncbi:MAG: DUF523 and DUF1722 domain-containing protein [Cellvibrionaceae bacterium]